LILDGDGRSLLTQSALDQTGMHLGDHLAMINVDPAELVLRPSYMCVSDSIHIERRSQRPTLEMFDDFEGDLVGLCQPPRRQTYFSNSMRFWCSDEDDFPMPSQRCVFGPITVLTIEFDPPSDWPRSQRVMVLEEQFDWLRRSGNARDSQKLQEIIRWAKQFADFRGLCVVYSGDKSLHFHFAFDTSEFCEEHPTLRDDLRSAYAVAHDKLAQAFLEHLPLHGLEPDKGMRQPEQFRRLPNGMRLVKDENKHLFRVPTGRRVNQSVLYEEVLKQAPRGANRQMFSKLMVMQAHAVKLAKQQIKRPSGAGIASWYDDDEREYCLEAATQLYTGIVGIDGYPRVSHFEHSQDSIALKLFANATDQKPGGILFASSSQPHFAGGKQPETNPSIGLPLREHLKRWRKKWRRCNPDIVCDKEEGDVATSVLRSTLVAPDIKTARAAFEQDLRQAVAENTVIMVKGPAGFGKTTAMMLAIPDLVSKAKTDLLSAMESSPRYEHEIIRSAVSAVATSGYEQAAEKCAQFNEMHTSNVAVGFVFKSFDRLYCDALADVYGAEAQEHKVVAELAAQRSYSSILGAIRTQQPQVWQRMIQLHDDMLAPLRSAHDDCAVVMFMVHDVLHQWTEGGLSRFLSHPKFFETNADELWTLEESTKLIVAVQDEIALTHLIHLVDQRRVMWCEGLFADDPSIWDDTHIHLGDAYPHWVSYKALSLGGVPFDEVISIKRLGLSSQDEVGVGPLEAYGQTVDGKSWDMYAATHKWRFAHRARSWWRNLAHHTVILTTEALPVTLFQISERSQPATVVLDHSNGAHPDGVAELHVVGNLSAETNSQIAVQIREHEADLDLFVIANKCADLDRSVPHTSAKGVNHLADENILQLINSVSPSEYAKLQAINMIFHMQSALRLYHIDQINQTMGRNLGYRFQRKRHIAYAPSALWRHIENGPIDNFAFQIDQIEDAPRRRDKRAGKARTCLAQLERDYEADMVHEVNVCCDDVIDQQAQDIGLIDDVDFGVDDFFPTDDVIDAAIVQMQVQSRRESSRTSCAS